MAVAGASPRPGGRRIAVVTGEPLTPAMAGPAIRAWEIARTLADEHDVRLATHSPVCRLEHGRFDTMSVTPRQLRELEGWCEILVFQGTLLDHHPWLRDSTKVLVVDIYDPFHLEVLEQLRGHDELLRARAVDNNRRALNTQLLRGDFFVCASSKQRDFWLGHLASVGRINPLTYDADSSLLSLIGVAAFGIPDEKPAATARVLKGVVPGIGPADKVVLWGGGLYNWLDPLTLVRAIQRLHARRPEVRLFFLGMKHPNPEVEEMSASLATRQLCDDLGLTGSVVFFNESWVEYDARANYLLEADVGVSTHHDHVETAFSYRTRILDYLWAGLPVVATGGDALGELINGNGLGRTVPAEDVGSLELALEEMLFDDAARATVKDNLVQIAPSLTWARVLGPLLAFCRDPARAPDLVSGPSAVQLRARTVLVSRQGLRHDVMQARRLVAEGGLGHAARKAVGRVRRRVSERTSRR